MISFTFFIFNFKIELKNRKYSWQISCQKMLKSFFMLYSPFKQRFFLLQFYIFNQHEKTLLKNGTKVHKYFELQTKMEKIGKKLN